MYYLNLSKYLKVCLADEKTPCLIIYFLSLKLWLTSQLQLYLFIYMFTDLRGQRIVHLYHTVIRKISLVVSSVNQKVIWKILHWKVNYFHGSPVVKTLPSSAGVADSVPGQ